MSYTKKTSAQKTDSAKDLDFEADVLFQRIYDKWYAFSVVEEECLMSEVSPEEVKARLRRMTKAA